MYDGGDLYPWTNNDSLIDWSGVKYNTISDDGFGGSNSNDGNATSATPVQNLPVLPPFELYQVTGRCSLYNGKSIKSYQ